MRISRSCFLFDLNYQVLLCCWWACEVKTEAVSLHSRRQNERRPSSTQGQKLTVYRGTVVCPALSQVPSTQHPVWGVSLRSVMMVLFLPIAGEGQETRKAEWHAHCQDSNPGLTDSGPHAPITKRLPLCCEGSPAPGWGRGRKGSPGAGHRLAEPSCRTQGTSQSPEDGAGFSRRSVGRELLLDRAGLGDVLAITLNRKRPGVHPHLREEQRRSWKGQQGCGCPLGSWRRLSRQRIAPARPCSACV